MPKTNLLWYLLFVFFLFVRINKGAFFLITLLASFAAPLLDPLFDSIGYSILLFKPLAPVYGALLDVPFVGFTKFNNTIVAGALTAGFVLYIPFYAASRVFVRQWRKHITPAVAQLRCIRFLYKLPLVSRIVKCMAEAD